jgi:CheY-like chemotaxis protein
VTKPIKPSSFHSEIGNFFANYEGTAHNDAAPQGESEKAEVELEYPKYRVLIAEDNLTNQTVAKAILGNLGCECIVANNGNEALKIVEEQGEKLDIVFMDCRMPQLDGYETTSRIRNLNGALSQIPIVAMTAHAIKGDREKVLSAGMDDYLAKPIRPRQVEAVLNKWTEKPLQIDKVDSVPSHEIFQRQILNYEDLLERMGGLTDLADSVLKDFATDCPRLLAALDEAAEMVNPAEMRETAHRLKGAATNVGAVALAEVAENLQKTAEEGDFKSSLDLLTNLKSAANEVLLAVEERVGDLMQ